MSENQLTIEITLTEKQAETVMDALEFYARVHMGQFDTIAYQMHMDISDKTLKRPEFDLDKANDLLDQARQIIFPHMNKSAYAGIQMTGERSKIAWDIYQQMRHDFSHYKYPNTAVMDRGIS